MTDILQHHQNGRGPLFPLPCPPSRVNSLLNATRYALFMVLYLCRICAAVRVKRCALARPSTAPGLSVDKVESDKSIFWFNNFNISLVFCIQDTLLPHDPSGLVSHSLGFADTQAWSCRKPWIWSHIGVRTRLLAAEPRSIA